MLGVLPVQVELLEQDEAPQSGREHVRVHHFWVVESLQRQTPPDPQPAQVSEGARTAWRARFMQMFHVSTVSSAVPPGGYSVRYNHNGELLDK